MTRTAVFFEAWSGTTAYLAGDIVTDSGVAYLCISGHTNHMPPNGTYWLSLAGSGATFGTPAIVLGTAAGNGTVDEAIRRDSTIVAFDGTAPSTQAFGDAAATGSAAVAARRDHKHAMPANPFVGASAGGVLDGTYPNPGLAAGVAGAGLAETSDVLSVNVDGSTIEIATDTLQLKDGGVTSAKIANGTIVDADVNSSAAVAYSKLALSASLVAADLSTALTNSLQPWTLVPKTLDETVTGSTTVQDDDELFFTAASGGLYYIVFFFVYASPSGAGTPDLKFDLGEDSTKRGVHYFPSFTLSENAQIAPIFSDQTSTAVLGTAAANRAALGFGSHAGNGGTFKVRWAQNTSSGSPNGTVMRAGSQILYRRIV